MKHFDATRGDFAPYGFTCELWSPVSMARPDRHNEIELNFLRSGSLCYLLGGQHIRVQAGEIALFWAAIPHQIVNYDSAEPYYVATLPLAWFLGCDFPQSLANGALAGQILTVPASSEDEASFGRWTEDFGTGNSLQQRAAQGEIQARLLRFSLALAQSSAQPASKTSHRAGLDVSLSRADQIACYIARHYSEPLSSQRIASAVGLHANYAMGVFQKAFGTTISAFLLQHRLSHAQRLLVTTDESIIEIAAQAGFGSLSRFNQAFKSSCGCSPRAYRQAHRGSSSPLITASIGA